MAYRKFRKSFIFLKSTQDRLKIRTPRLKCVQRRGAIINKYDLFQSYD